MSAQGHATPNDAAASHDHHYEGIPADRPGPGEPHTPLWLPLVGLVLALFSLLAYVITRPAGKTAAELAAEVTPEASAAAPAAPQPQPNASAMPQRPRRIPGLASALPVPPAPPATAPGGTPPRMRPGSPPRAPGANPPHGAPGHVHNE